MQRTVAYLIQKQKGFTLVETLIYIAFFALLVGSLLGITFQTIASTDQVSRKIAIEQEGNFLLKKIEWALSGATSVVLPNTNTTDTKVQVNKINFASNPITFDVSSNMARIRYGASPGGEVDLTSQNVQVTDFNATHTVVSLKEWIEVGFKVNGQQFQITKYLRK